MFGAGHRVASPTASPGRAWHSLITGYWGRLQLGEAMSELLTGQVALVTGGGRGIGQGIARAFAAEGAAVAVMSRTESQLAETVAQCEVAGATAIGVTGDVTSRDDVERVVAEVERRLGPLTILVNNAGITGPLAPVHAADPDEWWRTQEVHVHGMFLCTPHSPTNHCYARMPSNGCPGSSIGYGSSRNNPTAATRSAR